MPVAIKTQAFKALVYNEEFNEEARKALIKTLYRSSAEMARQAGANAKAAGIYDPGSPHAAGETNFPAKHHADSMKPFIVDEKKNGVKGGFMSTSGRGWWLEVGTVKMAARPHMKPAFDQRADEVKDLLQENFRKIKIKGSPFKR